jgi:signal transduction histidine kinase
MSIRLRLAVVFALASAILFAFGGWLFVTVLSSSLMSSIDSQLAAQAAQASQYLSSSSPATAPATTATNPPEYMIQLVDQTGQVRAASEEAGNRPILSRADLNRARNGQIFVTRERGGEHERVLAEPFTTRSGWVAVAGVSLQSFDRTINRVVGELAAGGSVFVAIAALGAYGLATAALRPVERLRREVAALSERDSPSVVGVPRTRDEIAALAQTMNDLLQRLQRALERERNLVADASHELRTPFAVLRGELELASRPGRSREELLAAVTSASEEAARLTRLADDLLLLTRSDQGQLPLRVEPTDVARLLSDSAERAASRARAAQVTCRVQALTGLSARLDPDRIRQALDNLVDNALRFAPAGSEILLSARVLGRDLAIEVADDGSGFPPEFLPHAFERFRRPDASRSRGNGGAGLGLAIVKAIAVAHGGQAMASNLPGSGACVRLKLPQVVGGGGGGGGRSEGVGAENPIHGL